MGGDRRAPADIENPLVVERVLRHLRRLGARSAVQTVAASSASRRHRCKKFRGRKTVAAAPARQASPLVPKLSTQAASCDVPPN
jgi:hypothetical protein